MRFIIKHEIKGRIRVHAVQRKMTMKEADILCYYLEQTPGVTKVKVYEQTGDATVEYQGGREEILDRFRAFSYDVSVPDSVLESSGRALNAEYKEKLIYSVTRRAVMKWLVPCSITNVITGCKVGQIPGSRYQMPGKRQAGSAGTGCNSNRGICIT